MLVNPNILLFFLGVSDGRSMGPSGFIAFVNRDGKTIAADGISPRDGHTKTQSDNGRISVTLVTPDGRLKVIGAVSTDWILRHWHDLVIVGAPLTALSVFLLLSIFLLIFRRVESLDHDLKIGLNNNEFELHYQPIIDLKSGTCVGSETLIRWRHPEEGMLLPNVFIPAAEKTGLIGAIGEWVIKQTVKEQGHLLEHLPLLHISINVSPIELNSGSFDNIIKWLPEASLASSRIILEVTEEAIIMETQTTAMDTLARTRTLGCSVALDDFGTGYSSLNLLRTLPLDTLKIDRSFVGRMEQAKTKSCARSSISRTT
ncbi:MAG: EAL domain-containing protein [Bacteroidetes bacterium]|nr:EAL domain-containing protein [Bacteroidota bacterium]